MNGWTPLHFAASNSPVEAVKILVDAYVKRGITNFKTFESSGVRTALTVVLKPSSPHYTVGFQSGLTPWDLAMNKAIILGEDKAHIKELAPLIKPVPIPRFRTHNTQMRTSSTA